MYCKNCGKEIPEDSKFCPQCGSRVVEEQTEAIVEEPQVKKELPAERSYFALLGFVLSLVSIFISLHGIVSIGAIILSVIGINECNREKRPGKGLAIWGVVISVLSLVLRYLFMLAILSEFGDIFHEIMHIGMGC